MKVLVAEDDVVSRRLVTKLVTDWGHEVIEASDGSAAWEILGSFSGPSLVILDWMMPGVDGIELCRRIRASSTLSSSYVVVLTARTDARSILEGFDAGADDFLAKPFEKLELRARLNAGIRVLGLQAQLAERVRELEAAAATVKRLEGLLPICCSCKRIRDGEDSWSAIEAYVSARTDARFSHGFCPECLHREVGALDTLRDGLPPK